MSQPSNKISGFWQELKRRKVVRVITVYAAAAFVILELLSIIIEPLRLPEWTLQFAIVFLCIGFIIAIILSWIYDIHPEGGIVKTEPFHKIKEEDIPKSSNSWRIASYISFVLIVALVILNIIPRSNRSEESTDLVKSIAILPFKNISPDSSNQYLLDGIMEAVLNYLTKVENVLVIASTSVEQYRGTNKPISEIGNELNVNYILEGSGQKYEENFRLTTKLSDVKSSALIWSNPYDREVKDILKVQSEIAQKIVTELSAELSKEDLESLHSKPTFSEKAYQNYLIAHELRSVNFPRAIELLEEAIAIDPRFVDAYVKLSRLYVMATGNPLNIFSSEEASSLALPPLEKALEIDPNHAGVHNQLANIKYSLEWDFKGAEDEFLLAAEISGMPIGQYGSLLIQNRRYREALELASEIRDVNPAGNVYISKLSYLLLGEYEKALNASIEANYGTGKNAWVGRIYMAMDDFDQAIANMEYTIERSRTPFWLSDLAICFYITGETEKTNEIINELVDGYDQGEHGSIAFALGKIYSGLGEVELSLEWLERSYEDHELEMIWLYADPAFEILQDNEQYIDLLRRVGFAV